MGSTEHAGAPHKPPAERFVSVDLNGGRTASKKSFRAKAEINFENHKEAFKEKTTWEILRALCVLRMCSINVFVDNSLQIMACTKRMLGRCGLRILFKPMFYNQFVGGESILEIQECIHRLSEKGIRPMLAVTLEEDIGESEGEGNNSIYDENCNRILQCLEIASSEQTPEPMMQLKMSGLLPANVLVALGQIYENTENKINLIQTVSKCMTEEELKVDADNVINDLDAHQLIAVKKALKRLHRIGKEASAANVKILVDAEYTYMNSGLTLLTLVMAVIFNQNSPAIWNTYQCYLKDARSNVDKDLKLIEKLNVCFGIKLVRGAYVLQERSRAEKLQITDPVCKDYEATCQNYNKVLELLLEYTKTKWPKFSLIVASHNEESVKLAIQRMKEYDISEENGGVCFGQLYGMCDQLTFPLAACGYATYKSIPYGTIEEVLPYLARRAVENRTVLAGTRKEQSLLWKEFKYRLKPRSSCCRNR